MSELFICYGCTKRLFHGRHRCEPLTSIGERDCECPHCHPKTDDPCECWQCTLGYLA